MDKIYFTWGGLELQEPMALITNWLVSIACILFFLQSQRASPIHTQWRSFFLFMGLSTFFGGLGHLFFQYTGMLGKEFAWWLSAVAVMFAERTILSFIKNQKWIKIISIILIAKCLFVIILSALTQEFGWILASTGVAFMVVMLPWYIGYLKSERQAAKLIILGIMVLIIPAIIQVLKYSPALWFNKDDLAHVLMLVAICFFFLGARRLPVDD